jgi:hypothetical protein
MPVQFADAQSLPLYGPHLIGEANLLPGGSDPMPIGEKSIRLNVDAYNKARKKEIADDTTKLLSLAIALKAELDHSGQAPLADAVRKANQIEKLARRVRKKMNIAFGPDLLQ